MSEAVNFIAFEFHDNDFHSDAMTDYYHCSWYNQIHVGKWNKPYILEVK